ncbi:MAG: hypothetical protein LBR60_00445 [Fibrobacter sp.]|jgi:hypothetical protein|nr:hypothetical protein [Fibrobacter sp.]
MGLSNLKINLSKNVILVTLYVLVLFQFFKIFSLKYPYFIFLALLFLFTVVEIPKSLKFKRLIILMCLGICVSFVSSLYFRNQPVVETFKASIAFFSILFYFFLTNRKFSILTIEKTILILGILASCIYILQTLLLPLGIRIIPVSEITEFGSSRFRIAGSGVISLVFFLALNKVILGKSILIHRIGLFLTGGTIVLMGFRTLLAGLILFSILLFLRCGVTLKKSFKVVVISFAIAAVLLCIPQVNDRLFYMVQKQQLSDQTFVNADYARWREWDHFMHYHFKSNWEMLLGSGMPGGGTDYGKYDKNLQESWIFWVDWGLIGLSWMIGIFPVLCMIGYSLLAFVTKVPKSYLYAGVWFLFLVAISVTTMEFYRFGNFAVQALALYLVVQVNKSYQLKLRCKS